MSDAYETREKMRVSAQERGISNETRVKMYEGRRRFFEARQFVTATWAVALFFLLQLPKQAV